MSEQTHYTVPELAKMYRVSDDTIRRDFRNDVEVLHVGAKGTKNKKSSKDILRIPQSAVNRWLEEKRRRGVKVKARKKAAVLPRGEGKVLDDGAITPKSIDACWESL